MPSPPLWPRNLPRPPEPGERDRCTHDGEVGRDSNDVDNAEDVANVVLPVASVAAPDIDMIDLQESAGNGTPPTTVLSKAEPIVSWLGRRCMRACA